MKKLTEKKCVPCEGGVSALSKAAAEKLLAELSGWKLNPDATQLIKYFEFKNFYQTMAFVNAIAWIANQENHHPVLELSYNYCQVTYYTHAIRGLSENDFICAAKIDLLQ